jgi:uncharacterized membrane protein
MSATGWTRFALALAGGVFLSFTLVAVVGAVLVRTPEMHLFFNAMREGQAGHDLPPGRASAVLAAIDLTSFRMRWLMGPGIAALVGVFIGFVARERVWQTAVLASVPYAFLFSDSWTTARGVMFSALYAGVAGLTAWTVDTLVRRLPTNRGA